MSGYFLNRNLSPAAMTTKIKYQIPAIGMSGDIQSNHHLEKEVSNENINF